MGAVGLVGMLLFMAGAHLLWQARAEVLYWLGEFLRLLRMEFMRRGVTPREQASAVAAAEARTADEIELEKPPTLPIGYRGTLRLVAGVCLMFLGPVLFFIDLAF